ncbi:MAG TPA: right-handed parallel beta-helix repeat-containing protein, partial [Mucilaginibacter sp.]|nr:right-handed parallel beta-helix repeat-containing protein [Mucilaginibacter sp.]
MERFVLMLFSVLLVFLSCKKTDNAVPVNYKNDIQTAAITHANLAIANTMQTPAVNIDTVPPANAVNIKKYHAKGNGVSDDSKALQNAVNAENIIVLPAGTYIITKTIAMRAGVKIYGTNGAVIKAGLSMNGTLLTQGRFFQLQNDDNCSFINLEFQSAGAFKPSVWNNACIYVQDSRNTAIGYNYFNFSLPYAANGVNAIWVTGSQSANTIIERNILRSVGIEYAEAGASGTIVDGNTIDHAPKDALSAHGDSGTYCTGNVVTNNVITNSGMMGIEDWGKVDGTIIKGNTITGCGKDPAQQADGMGISAVGINSLVANNTITDAQAYYIECARNNTINGNTINDTKGQAVGIIANYTVPDSSAARRLLNTHNISNNVITGCSFAVFVYGNNVTNDIIIASNTVINPFKIGINIDNASTAFNIMVSN